MCQSTTYTSDLCVYSVCVSVYTGCEIAHSVHCIFCHLPHSLICVFAAGKFFRRYSLEWKSACGGAGWRRERKKSEKERSSIFNKLSQTVFSCSAAIRGEQERPYTLSTFFWSLKLKLSALKLALHRTNWDLLFAPKSNKQHKSLLHSWVFVEKSLRLYLHLNIIRVLQRPYLDNLYNLFYDFLHSVQFFSVLLWATLSN